MPADAAALLRDRPAADLARSALATLAATHQLPDPPSTDDLQRTDLTEYLTNDILVKVDRMSMAHGLESRAPLLNPALIDFALALPDEARVGARGQTKTLLRLLCERHFGRGIARAAKQGFSIPIHQWLRTAGVDLLDDLLSPASVESLELLDPAPIARALRDHQSGRRALGWELWGLMVLSAWHRRRIATSPRAPAPGRDDLIERRPVVAT